MIAVGYGGAPGLKLPSIDLEGCCVSVRGDSGDSPSDVTAVGARVVSKPMKSAGVIGTSGAWGLKSKTKSDGLSSRLAAEDSANNAHVEVICGTTRGEAENTGGLIAIQLRRLIGQEN